MYESELLALGRRGMGSIAVGSELIRNHVKVSCTVEQFFIKINVLGVLLGLLCLYIFGASLSEPHLVMSTAALSVYMYVCMYVCMVRTYGKYTSNVS